MHVHKMLEVVRSSLWFLPGTIVLGSIGLAVLLVEAEWTWPIEVLRNHAPRFFATSPDDARQLLGAIATSMLTVAGVTFSVTAVTLSLIASQYTPRVVRTFMRSRKTQVTLGVLMGVYAYALVVLRTVSGGKSPYVPDLAVNFANLYAIAGLFIFILFVHHIASFIQPATIATGLSSETLESIRATYPIEGTERAASDRADIDKIVAELNWHPLLAPKDGYIQEVKIQVLADYGTRSGNVTRLALKIGEFVIEGEPLLYVANAEADNATSMCELIAAVSLGAHRTIEQDPGFGVRQLVDMTLKGLSPAINDPTTAMLCIDHLAGLLSHFSRRCGIEAHRGEGTRIHAIVPRPEFEEILIDSIEPICLAAQEHPQVLERLLRMLAKIAHEVPPGLRRREVWRQMAVVAEQANRLGPVPGRSRLISVAARVRADLEAQGFPTN